MSEIFRPDFSQENSPREQLGDPRLRSEVLGYIKRFLIDKGVGRHEHIDSLADELTQQAYVKAWSAIDRFRNESTVKTWLCSIVVREALLHFRSKSKRKTDLSIDGVVPEGISAAVVHPDAEVKIELEEVMKYLGENFSPREQQELLNKALGDSSNSLAQQTGQKKGSVQSRISRARSKLREEFRSGDSVDEAEKDSEE